MTKAEKTHFKVDRSIHSTYSGGPVLLDGDMLWTIYEDKIYGHDIQKLHGGPIVVLGESDRLQDEGEEEEEDPVISFITVPHNDACIKLPKAVFVARKSQTVEQWVLEDNSSGDDSCKYKLSKSWKPHTAPVLYMRTIWISNTQVWLATASSDHTIKIWEIDYRKSVNVLSACRQHLKGHSSIVTLLLFETKIQNNDVFLYSGSQDGKVRIWDLGKDGKCIAQCEGHTAAITGLAITESGFLITSSRDNTIHIWNQQTKVLFKTLAAPGPIESVFSLKDKESWYFVTAGSTQSGEKGLLTLWDPATGERLGQTILPHPILYMSFVSKEDRSTFACATQEHNVHMYDCYSNGSKRSKSVSNQIPEFKPLGVLIGHHQEITDLAFLKVPSNVQPNQEDQGYIPFLVASTNAADLRLFPGPTSSDIKYVNNTLVYGHSDVVLCLSVPHSSMDSSHGIFVSGSKDTTARLWRAKCISDTEVSVECIGVAKGHSQAIGAVAIQPIHSKSMNSSDMAWLMATASQDQTIKIWTWKMSTDNNKCLISQGNSLLPANSKDPYLFESAGTIRAHEKEINSIDISSHGKSGWIATASQDKTIKLWSIHSIIDEPTSETYHGNALYATLSGHRRGVWSVKFNSQGSLLVSASADRTIRIWSIPSGSSSGQPCCIHTLEGHSMSVLRAVFLNNSTQIMSCGSDGIVKLWRVPKSDKSDPESNCISTWDKQHQDRIWALSMFEDSSCYMATGGADAIIHIWKDHTEEHQEAIHNEKRQELLLEQEYQNLVVEKDYIGAIRLALSRKQPYRLLQLLHKYYDTQTTNSVDLYGIHDIVLDIVVNDDELLGQLLVFIQDWNTQWKHAWVSQKVLGSLFQRIPMERWLKLPNLENILSGLTPYIERYHSKIEDTCVQSFILDYFLCNSSSF
jgi:U3 small nucleolar RNA-associated protein 13